MEKIYKVPRDGMDALVAKLDKLSAKAAKCGQAAFQLQLVKEFSKEETLASGLKVYTPYVMFTLDAVQPKLNGWSFLATINHTDDGNVVRALPGAEPDPKWQTVGPQCDHCHWKRKRNDSYIVQNEQGEVKQVGRSCLADFIGHVNPHEIAKYAEYLIAAAEACEVAHSNAEQHLAGGKGKSGFRSFDPKIHPYLDLRTFLAKTLQVIREEGWISKTEAFETGKNATADRALFRLFEDTRPPLETDYTLAQQAIEWVETLDPQTNDYYATLVAVAGNGSGAFDHKRIGVVASIGHVYPAMLEEKLRQTLLSQSGADPFIGAKGDSVTFEGTVILRRSYRTHSGSGVILKFADALHRVATVFMPSRDFHNLESTFAKPIRPGTHLQVSGAVRDHETFRGEQQTILSKVQLQPFSQV